MDFHSMWPLLSFLLVQQFNVSTTVIKQYVKDPTNVNAAKVRFNFH